MTTPARQFRDDAAGVTSDRRQRQLVQTALGQYEVKRDERKALFQDWAGARQAATAVKRGAVRQLDRHLLEFVRQLEARGGQVHWAADATEARQIILDIIQRRGGQRVVKSKTMTSEEIHLNPALEAAGIEVVESDLGEFIVQLRREAPYHIVFPAMHLTRGQIRDLFADRLGEAPSDAPEALTMVARRHLREKYLQADVGITGANFAVAETGMVAVTENEGNARLTAALPRTMITLVGVEKVVPRLADLALLWPMLSTVGAGQLLSGYNTLYAGPRQQGEPDGPEEYHVVLLDNGRTSLLADPVQWDALQCIRCGACLNVCPVYRKVGGHTYGSTYAGPIGAVVTPHLRAQEDWAHLSLASSLCGACTEACPVGIDLHHHLLRNRRSGEARKAPRWERWIFKLLVPMINRPPLWALATRAARAGQVLHRLVRGTRLDPARAWTQTRDLPPVARLTFREWWKTRS